MVNINEVIECAFKMKQASEHLYFVAKRLEESGLVDYHRAGEMSIDCDNAYQVFRLAGCRYLGQDVFEARMEKLEQLPKAFEVY